MKRIRSTLLGVALGLTVLFTLSTTGSAEEAPRINKEEVKAMMENPDVIIVDIRKTADLKIKGAVREEPGNLLSLARRYPKNQVIILYCA